MLEQCAFFRSLVSTIYHDFDLAILVIKCLDTSLLVAF
jgi:hypothetical protein